MPTSLPLACRTPLFLLFAFLLEGCGEEDVRARLAGSEASGSSSGGELTRALLGSPAPNPALAREHFTKGRRLIFGSRVKMNYDTFDYAMLEEALAELETAVSLSPEDAEIAYWAGRGWMLRHDDEKALVHFQRAAELRPNHADTHRYLGSSWLAIGHREEGRAALRQALALGSEGFGLFLECGTLSEEDGDLEGARGYYERAMASDPIQALPHFRLGTLLFRLGETDTAEEEVARFDLLRKAQRKLETAIRELRANPRDPRLLTSVGAAYLEAEDYEEALVWVDRALAICADDATALMYRGITLRHLGRTEEARQSLEAAVAVAPDSPSPRRELAALHAARGERDLALGNAAEVVRLAPDDPLSHCCLGAVHAATADSDAARASFARAIDLDANCLPALLGHAEALWQAGQSEAAIAGFEAVLRLDSHHLAARRALRRAKGDTP